ncbi:hypothetical protein CNMCM7691_006088 [Aspergillus felis]|nr:hypothetical protein CNMCM7691_006088 [Aspergillus felis]
MMPDNQYQPSFVIEVGWSESPRWLVEDMRQWMMGGRPHVKIVLILKFARKGRTNEVTGKAELYVRDAAGNPFCQQEATSFPETTTKCRVQPRRLNGAIVEHQHGFPSARPAGEVEKRSRTTASPRETDDGDEERATVERHSALMGLLMTLKESCSRKVEGDLEQSVLSYVQRSTESTNNSVLILDSIPCGTGISVLPHRVAETQNYMGEYTIFSQPTPTPSSQDTNRINQTPTLSAAKKDLASYRDATDIHALILANLLDILRQQSSTHICSQPISWTVTTKIGSVCTHKRGQNCGIVRNSD